MRFGPYGAVILAAGFSSRMERGFKPLLPIPAPDGSSPTALERVVALYAAAEVSPLIVVAGHRHDALAAATRALPVRLVRNTQAEAGMLSSIRVGLMAAAGLCGHCFLHPVDIPLVLPATLHRLCEAAAREPEHICIPVHAGEEGHPPCIPVVYTANILAWDSPGGLREAMRGLPCRHVPVDDPGVLLDMDTDADYARLCALARHGDAAKPRRGGAAGAGRGGVA